MSYTMCSLNIQSNNSRKIFLNNKKIRLLYLFLFTLIGCIIISSFRNPNNFSQSKENNLPPKKCSVCSAWGSTTKDGKLIGMDTLDGGGDAMYGVILVVFPNKGNAYICGAQAGEIGDHFLMNNKGLFLGNSGGGGSPRDKDNNYGLSWSCSLTHLVRFSDSAFQARDMLLPWQINIPENFIVLIDNIRMADD